MKMQRIFDCARTAVLILTLSAMAAPVGAEDSSVRERAATVIAASESFAQGIKTSYQRTGKVITDINILIADGYLSAYPKTSHSQSDFYSRPYVVEEAGGAGYYLRYSLGEPDAEDVCKVLNESSLGLRPGSPVSATSLGVSSLTPGAIVFSPPPVEIVGKKSFCLRIDGNYEYFYRVLSVSP